MNYAHSITLSAPFDEAVRLTREALAAQGFGILTEIDVNATFAAKLGPEVAATLGDYLILGACNPPLAHRAITADPNIGLLLPCNVVVRRGPGATETLIQAIDPATMVQLSGQEGIQAVADEADTRLRAALDSVQATAAE
ncbi:DUF302 domain-containing protein [Cryobacterium psychrophilum]|uniref:DUF302 domain-containing protein n=1 Tax=Cryobacterium psychrophilum TaxID=41988 RepID=A0A4Y8KQ50_9MICO|nr:DUF302 domain-containing protein [Cryobacterium psychrophilum]TDW31170.1 uncharacterized protein (DUF302 family) [Cryobacterium psychrophilum]TFD78536.1 DUF302 domain-containing protein [Cryobacterium psychrophilum]